MRMKNINNRSNSVGKRVKQGLVKPTLLVGPGVQTIDESEPEHDKNYKMTCSSSSRRLIMTFELATVVRVSVV